MNSKDSKTKTPFSRRGFMQGAGVGASAVGILATTEEAQAQANVAAMGPAAVPITLTVNGKPMKLNVEPRETLLDTLRNKLDHTGAKRVCDRGTCGACTMIVDNKVQYGCTILAIDAQGKKIETIESLTANGKVHPIVPAFVNNDAQQCGYCTPGFVMASKGFLDKNPNPTYDQVKEGLGGNLCRCGTYVGIRKAVLEAAQALRSGKSVKGATNA
ncbi:MAG: (2Fe-2S)-binding protein [Acidobacteria bacterium]|nr:(2Fe-2S)-binding protein [Acidobacteriota bacterium]